VDCVASTREERLSELVEFDQSSKRFELCNADQQEARTPSQSLISVLRRDEG
jgi:hypothetical protein